MSIFDDIGKIALGSRVRFLGEKIGAEAAEIYRAYGNDLQPKWFPVFYVLSTQNECSGTWIAEKIGHSHASVSKILSEMAKAQLIVEKSDESDGRRTLVSLSKKGKRVASGIQDQYTDVAAAMDELLSEAKNDLWQALQEWEFLLDQKSLKSRVLKKKKERESRNIKIEAFQPKYKKAFYNLNQEWITTYFGKMEKPDCEALEDPKKSILDRGGFIFVATLDDEPVGVVALLKREDPRSYELAKMAVAPQARGKNIGFLLGEAAVKKAALQGANHVFLESNTILKPAINLYKKLGFKKIVGPKSPYARCNIQMELKL